MAIGQTAEGSGGFGPAAAGGQAGPAAAGGQAGPAAAGGQAGRVVPPGASRPRPSARERLLAAANELFYNEGVHTVGIDRVIEQAGVAKASLYNTFGSKDELVRAYLETRQASVAQRITQAVERYDTPRERLLAVFEGQGELFAQPDYRGCAFARASAESHPGDLAEQAAEDYRRWVRTLLTELAAQAGVLEPEVLARQLHLLYDGSGQSARMDHDPAVAAVARTAAATLLDAALTQGHQRMAGEDADSFSSSTTSSR